MFGDAVVDDALVQGLTARVRLAPDAAFDARFPARRGARVTAVLADGQRRIVDVPDRPGSPERPLGADRLAEKFAATAAPVLGDRARALYATLQGLDADTRVRSLDLGAAPVSVR
jgi:2-methylcitrate dehydratase PrpD